MKLFYHLVGKNWSQPFKPEFLDFNNRIPCWAWMYIWIVLYVLGSIEYVPDNQTTCDNWRRNFLRRKQDVSGYGSSQIQLLELSTRYVTFRILSLLIKQFFSTIFTDPSCCFVPIADPVLFCFMNNHKVYITNDWDEITKGLNVM